MEGGGNVGNRTKAMYHNPERKLLQQASSRSPSSGHCMLYAKHTRRHIPFGGLRLQAHDLLTFCSHFGSSFPESKHKGKAVWYLILVAGAGVPSFDCRGKAMGKRSQKLFLEPKRRRRHQERICSRPNTTWDAAESWRDMGEHDG